MSSVDWSPKLAAALDELVPLGDSSGGDWEDVVGRVGRRRAGWLARRVASRRTRLVLVVALLFLLLTGVATATYLLVRGSGGLALGGGVKLLVVNQNGPGLHAVASCPGGLSRCVISEPSWSPDGTRVAFLRGPFSLRSRMFVYVAAADGGGARRLASCGICGQQYGGQHPLAWSPDGRWIAFSRDAGSLEAAQALWVVAAAGGKLHRLTLCSEPCADVAPAWSPDGRLLAFQRNFATPGPGAGPGRLYTVRRDGSGLTRIARGADLEWSPNGRRIAFDSPDGVAVASADGSHMHVLVAGGASGALDPSWSPDGRKLVFIKIPGRRNAHVAEVWTMNADGSHKQRLYRSSCCVKSGAPPIWSPDGRLIAFSADSAGGTFVINADGSDLTRISPRAFGELSWQPAPTGGGK